MIFLKPSFLFLQFILCHSGLFPWKQKHFCIESSKDTVVLKTYCSFSPHRGPRGVSDMFFQHSCTVLAVYSEMGDPQIVLSKGRGSTFFFFFKVSLTILKDSLGVWASHILSWFSETDLFAIWYTSGITAVRGFTLVSYISRFTIKQGQASWKYYTLYWFEKHWNFVMESDRPGFESHFSTVIWFWANVFIIFLIGKMGIKPVLWFYLMVKWLKRYRVYEMLSSIPSTS